ncbi:replication-relaxation family protein [Priestia megaterium]|uniref:replication-relaxation family protein n=3 Tax=Priestia TaxID=2800373 RepID=UPI00366DDD21
MKKYITLNEQDTDLLIKLHDFIYVDSNFIVEHILTNYADRKYAMNRLRLLEESKYIKSFTVPMRGYEKPGNLYTLDAFGVEIVEELQGFSKWQKKWTTDVPAWYQHQLMLNRLVLSYTKQAEELGLAVKEWIPEARGTFQYGKSKSEVIKPDGVLVVGEADSDQNIGLFVELERSVAKRQNTIQKIIRYNDFLKRGKETLEKYDMHVGFEEPILDWRVLFIAGNETNTKKTMRDLLSIPAQERTHIKVPVLAANLEETKKDAFGDIYHYVFSNSSDVKKGL